MKFRKSSPLIGMNIIYINDINNDKFRSRVNANNFGDVERTIWQGLESNPGFAPVSNCK